MVDKIEYGDTGKVAREKINTIMDEVEANIPSIGDNGNWYLGPTDTDIPATGPEGPEGPQGPQGPQGEAGDNTDILSPQEYEDKGESTSSDDVIYMIFTEK